MASVSYRNNNPGNIRWKKAGFTTQNNRGGVRGEKGFAKFPTTIKGLACLADLLATITYSRLSILEVFERYAPAEDSNDPFKYAKFVSDYSGILIGTSLRDVRDPFKLLKFMEAIVIMEKWEF